MACDGETPRFMYGVLPVGPGSPRLGVRGLNGEDMLRSARSKRQSDGRNERSVGSVSWRWALIGLQSFTGTLPMPNKSQEGWCSQGWTMRRATKADVVTVRPPLRQTSTRLKSNAYHTVTCTSPHLLKIMTPRAGGGVEVVPKVELCAHVDAVQHRYSTLETMFKFDFDVEAEEPQASGSTVPAPLQRGEVKPSHDISLKDLVSLDALAAPLAWQRSWDPIAVLDI